MMLHHMGLPSAAQNIEDALVEVYRRGAVRTADLGGGASTDEFADAICALLG
jgi:isocitrate dehydrogenase (NAD+)